jgi:hypothetical protein
MIKKNSVYIQGLWKDFSGGILLISVRLSIILFIYLFIFAILVIEPKGLEQMLYSLTVRLSQGTN